jgi:hypothetical protein
MQTGDILLALGVTRLEHNPAFDQGRQAMLFAIPDKAN